MVSANVRGLRTNVGDLSHNFVLRQSADIVAVTETWLSDEVEPTFGRISGYSQWVRNKEVKVMETPSAEYTIVGSEASPRACRHEGGGKTVGGDSRAVAQNGMLAPISQ